MPSLAHTEILLTSLLLKSVVVLPLIVPHYTLNAIRSGTHRNLLSAVLH